MPAAQSQPQSMSAGSTCGGRGLGGMGGNGGNGQIGMQGCGGASALARSLRRLTAAALAGGRIVVAWTHIITPIALSRFLFAINTICRAAPIGALAIPPVLRYTP